MCASQEQTPSCQPITQYRQRATYLLALEQTRNDFRQAYASFPSGPLRKVYYPQVCNCSEMQRSHYHPTLNQHVHPTPSKPSANGQVIKPPETTSLELRTDSDVSSTSSNQPPAPSNSVTNVNSIQKLANPVQMSGDPTGLEARNPPMKQEQNTWPTFTLELGKGYEPFPPDWMWWQTVGVGVESGRISFAVAWKDGASFHRKLRIRRFCMQRITRLSPPLYDEPFQSICLTLVTPENAQLLPLEWSMSQFNQGGSRRGSISGRRWSNVRRNVYATFIESQWHETRRPSEGPRSDTFAYELLHTYELLFSPGGSEGALIGHGYLTWHAVVTFGITTHRLGECLRQLLYPNHDRGVYSKFLFRRFILPAINVQS